MQSKVSSQFFLGGLNVLYACISQEQAKIATGLKFTTNQRV